jgi:hypothetical protein
MKILTFNLNTMKKFLLFLISLTSLIPLLTENAFSQACGRGTYSVIILTKEWNPELNLNLTYEIIPVNELSLSKAVSEDTLKELNCNMKYGTVISEKIALAIADSTKDDHFFTMIKSETPVTGSIPMRHLNFRTWETSRRPFLVKFSSGEKSVYVLACFFGRCYTQTYLHWDESPYIARGQ